MLDWLAELNSRVNELVWGPPMMVLLVGTGIYVAARTRAAQITLFGKMLRETVGRLFRRGPEADGDVTPFQALSVAMGGTVGVGNIAGVATAIAAGGPGAIFWMMVSGLLGMGTKFAEVTLGLHYRKREPGGPMVGGPMMYIVRGMGPRWRWMASLFAILAAVAALGIGNMVQANAVAQGVEELAGLYDLTAPRWITGLVLVAAVGLVTVGGIRRIARVAMFFVPFMCGLYMAGALVAIVMFAHRLPEAIRLILAHAFTPAAAAGGFAGAGVRAAMRMGLARGIFSNEAGLGSAPMAHATAQTDHACRQGLWGIFEVFVDTIVICLATALVILLTGAWTTGKDGAALTMHAFGLTFGQAVGPALVVLSMILTAYDTNLAWCFYGETCSAYLLGGGASPGHREEALLRGRITRTAYRVLWLPFTVAGAVWHLEAVWGVADTLNGLMAVPNLIALVALGGVVARLTRDFSAGRPYVPPADEQVPSASP